MTLLVFEIFDHFKYLVSHDKFASKIEHNPPYKDFVLPEFKNPKEKTTIQRFLDLELFDNSLHALSATLEEHNVFRERCQKKKLKKT